MDPAPPSGPRSAGQIAALDELDRRILTVLQQDGRISMRALAARLHISRANAYTRVERLERAGVITGYSALVDPIRFGYGLSAYVYLKIEQQSWKAVRDRVLAMAEVEHAALVSGDNDIVLLVRAADAAALRDFVLTGLQEIPQVLGTRTVLIFDESAPRRPR
jgi:DNA-binding Lrp family transcriptional regulator